MSVFYIVMGLKHMFNPSFFLPMMPPFIPYKKAIIYITGFIEIILGLFLIIEDYRFYSGSALVIFLILVFPANIYLSINEEARKKMKVTKQFCVLRLFFQALLIYLAYWHSY